ncbi:MAG TPA: hypothetical protein VK154_10545 [Chitinophagales bacterium]|nr:hypothetical protein [Chitinophagales bacterium]
MKKMFLSFLIVFSFTCACRAQTPYFIEDINSCINVYDSARLQELPLLSLVVASFDGGFDTNFVAIVQPQKQFRKMLDYPYPNDTLQGNFDDMFGLNLADNSNFWTSAEINPDVEVPQQPTGFEAIYTLDSTLALINTVTMDIPYTYTYHGTNYNTNILYDVHDHNGFELNGKVYILAIGTHLEWYDAAASWIGADSMRVRFTTLHILEAATGKEMARWEPQKQGYTLENFGLPIHLQTLPGGIKMYSHPHLNIVEPQVDTLGGVSIYASARHPGIVNKLYWDGVSDTLAPQWMFGHPPRFNTPLYLNTVTTNQLDACHGASAYVKGDTTYMATYNNNPDIDSVGGTHQVWMVYNNTATLVWQSPDIGVRAICKGNAKWSYDGKYLLTTHGNCNGAIRTQDGQGNTITTTDYEKFQIWDPWTNTKIAGMYLTGSVYVALMQFIPSDKMLSFTPIDIVITDSVRVSHTNPGHVFYTVGNVKYFEEELVLPITYADTLDVISAWVKTGYTGAWRVDEKNVIVNTAIPQNLTGELFLSTVQNIEKYKLPQGYNWIAYNMVGAVVPADNINTPGLYVLEGYSPQNTLAYRKKHVFVK